MPDVSISNKRRSAIRHRNLVETPRAVSARTIQTLSSALDFSFDLCLKNRRLEFSLAFFIAFPHETYSTYKAALFAPVEFMRAEPIMLPALNIMNKFNYDMELLFTIVHTREHK